MVDSYSENKKLTRKVADYLKKVINQIIKNKTTINIPELGIENAFFEIELPPGVYEIVDINNTIKQIRSDSDCGFELNIQANAISMKSVSTSYHNIHFNSETNKLLGCTNNDYPAGTHKSEISVMITTTGKIHLKCDCVDGSIVNCIRERILFSFILGAPPGCKIIKKPEILLYKNKTGTSQVGATSKSQKAQNLFLEKT